MILWNDDNIQTGQYHLRSNVVDEDFLVVTAAEDSAIIGRKRQTTNVAFVHCLHNCDWGAFAIAILIEWPQSDEWFPTARHQKGPVLREFRFQNHLTMAYQFTTTKQLWRLNFF